MKNRLAGETSPYLLQHADNPVFWYPWCEEAFQRAQEEDKPIFLSIGYSTCHWCHVMARESFEDEEVARILNEGFISIKVDREERPDIDSVYMEVCQAFTGAGGWPMSIFMTPEQRPFYAGTYFPKHPSNMGIGFISLLRLIAEKWRDSREELLGTADEVVRMVNDGKETMEKASRQVVQTAVDNFRAAFDRHFGGFGREPKFPTPHNLMFLLDQFRRTGNQELLDMAEQTLVAMYRGGLFDHIGGGFARYSTDRYYLIPHFEKMLYDNGLLTGTYAMAYDVTGKPIYLDIARRTADFVLREMTNGAGGFYSALDADSEGEEGRFYAFAYDELLALLGEERGHAFNEHFGITKKGNFGGKNVPNLLHADTLEVDGFAPELEKIYHYRRGRARLHRDDKVLTAWNAWMIWGLCRLYQASGEEKYLAAARRADRFLQENLAEEEALFVSWRREKRGGPGFLDDYAYYCGALLALYDATLEADYLARAEGLCRAAIEEFADDEGGYYISGRHGEQLISRPKETYDGAMPSGNAAMAMNLARLAHLTGSRTLQKEALRQMDFLYPMAKAYPMGHSFYLLALLRLERPRRKLTCVLGEGGMEQLLQQSRMDWDVTLLEQPAEGYTRLEGQTTYYLCGSESCLPPSVNLAELLEKAE